MSRPHWTRGLYISHAHFDLPECRDICLEQVLSAVFWIPRLGVPASEICRAIPNRDAPMPTCRHLPERPAPRTDLLKVCVNCREPGFQGESEILARWSTACTISVDKGKLIAQAGPFALAALIDPTCNFARFR